MQPGIPWRRRRGQPMPGRRQRALPSSPDDSEDDDEKRKKRRRKTPKISERQTKRLLDKYGRQIWRKLRQVRRNTYGTIWKNKDVRIDIGHANTSQGQPNIKKWHLQINKEAKSEWAKKLKRNTRNTHLKMLEGWIDVDNTPLDYESWVKAVLDHFF